MIQTYKSMISNSYYRNHTNILMGDKEENMLTELRLINHILDTNFTLSDISPYYPKLSIKSYGRNYPEHLENLSYVLLVKYDHNHYNTLNNVYSNVYYIPYDLELLILQETYLDPDTNYNQCISLEYDNIETILKQSREIPKEDCPNNHYHTYGAEVIYIEGTMYKRFVMPSGYLMDKKKMNYPTLFREFKCNLFWDKKLIKHEKNTLDKYKTLSEEVFSCDNKLYNYIDSPHYEY